MDTPITQSKAWKTLQDDLGEISFYEEGKDYRYLAILKETPVGKYLYLPYGPVTKDKKGFNNALKMLKLLAEKHHAIFIRVEPQNQNLEKYLESNAKKSKDLNPKETWVLDLKGSDEELKEKLPSRLLRYYKNAEKNSLKIEISKNTDDIKHLLKLQKSLAKEKGISAFSENYLKTELKQPFATLYLVTSSIDGWRHLGDPQSSHSEDGGKYGDRTRREVIAAGMVFDDKTTRYNLQGAQSEQGRKLHATGILTIQLIKDAKAAGKSTFDFWGIAPEGAPKSHPWYGFTNFKKTFHGTEKHYAGTYDIVLNPVKYKLYQLTRKINLLLRKHS